MAPADDGGLGAGLLPDPPWVAEGWDGWALLPPGAADSVGDGFDFGVAEGAGVGEAPGFGPLPGGVGGFEIQKLFLADLRSFLPAGSGYWRLEP